MKSIKKGSALSIAFSVFLVIALCFWSIVYAFASEPVESLDGQLAFVETAESASSIVDDLEAYSENEPEFDDIETGNPLNEDGLDDLESQEDEADLEADLTEQLPLDLDNVDAGDAITDSINDDDSERFEIGNGETVGTPVIDTWPVGTPDASVLEYAIFTDKGISKGYNGFQLPAIGTFTISYDKDVTRLCLTWNFDIGTGNVYADQWFVAADFYMRSVRMGDDSVNVLGSEIAHYRNGNMLYRVYEVNFPDGIDDINQIHPPRTCFDDVDPIQYWFDGFTKQVGENADGEPEYYNFLNTQAYITRGQYDMPTIENPDSEPESKPDLAPMPEPEGEEPEIPSNEDGPIPEPGKPVIVPELVPAISQVDIPASTGLAQTGDDMGTAIVVLLVIVGLVVIWLLTGEHSPLKSRSKFYFGGSRMVRVIVTVAVLFVISFVLKALGLI